MKNLINKLFVFSAFLVLLSCLAALPVVAADEAGRPNILFIISDDFGVDVTSDMYPGMIDNLLEQYGPSGHNHPQYQNIRGHQASTPTLNELASQSMVFSHVWAHPFCSPTRASILTGLYGTGTRVLTYADPLSNKHTSFVKLLKEQGGYSTGLFGKWHLAGLAGETPYPGIKPKEAGFDIFKGNLSAAIPSYWDYPYEIQDDSTPANEWRTETPPMKSLPGIEPTNYAPVVKIADTIEWITEQESENPDKPWFAWLAFNLSHATSRQQPSAMAVPEASTLDTTSYAEMEACGGQFASNIPGACSGESLMRAMTNSMDTLMGKLLDVVDELDPNTYVIFVGDNGTPMYARPDLDFIDNMYLTKTGRGKGSAYESGARVPLAIRGPGIEPGRVNDEYLHTADIFSTTLALAGLDVPQNVSNSEGTGTLPLDGISITPLLFNQTTTVRDPDQGYVLNENINLMTNGTRIVGARNATYKIVCVDGSGTEHCEFYNLIDDPLEEYPLAEPASCVAYALDSWTPANESWHYCRLSEVVNTKSFFSEL